MQLRARINMQIAMQLRDQVAVRVPRMQSTVDPATARTLVGNNIHPNLELAAAGLGLHHGLYKNPSQAMRELEKAFPGSISASIHKNPNKAKGWRDHFARYEELEEGRLQETALAATLNPSTQPLDSPADDMDTDVQLDDRPPPHQLVGDFDGAITTINNPRYNASGQRGT